MAASGSSGSSFTSSSLGVPAAYAYAVTSPGDSTWTPSSNRSALTAESSAPPTPLRPLDLGPPGYQATITLYPSTPNEVTVYLGPWEILGTEERRVIWQCSYQGEVLEHFLPSDVPSQIFPFTLHANHRPYGDPAELELYLTFREAHRVRYTTSEGVIHDEAIEVKYEFTSVESSMRLQGDLRRRDMIEWFDVDVIWSDVHSRNDSFGNVRGMGTIQRLKLWRDRYSTNHSLAFFANRTERRFKEYQVNWFEGELRSRDDRHRRVRINAVGRRGSASESSSSHSHGSHHRDRDRRFSISSPFNRPRQHSSGSRSHASSSHTSAASSASSPRSPLDIRYLGLQFSRTDDYRRFLEQWAQAHSADSDFRGVPFPMDHVELPSPEIMGNIAELDAGESSHMLAPVLEPEGEDSEATP